MKIVPRITATLAHENASKIERVVSLRLTSKKKTAISLFRKTRTGCFPTQVRHASAYRRLESCGVKCVHMVSAIMSASISPDTASDPAWKHVSNTETTEIQRSRLPSSHPRHTALFSDSVGRKSSWSQISRGEDACADHFRILSRLPFSYEPREKHSRPTLRGLHTPLQATNCQLGRLWSTGITRSQSRRPSLGGEGDAEPVIREPLREDTQRS